MKEGKKTVRLMGTTITLKVTHEQPEPVLNEIVARLKMYEHRFSANASDSELSEINQMAGQQAVKVHPELFELIKIGKEHSLAAGSFLNIALGPLVQTWRIGFDNARVPTAAEIRSLLAQTDPNKIHLDVETSSVYLSEKGMKIDLGALAKGYIADRIVDYLKDVHAQAALINLGGNIVTYGPALNRVDKHWRIGIQNPVKTRGNSQIVLRVKNQSIVTSGIYERNLKAEGEVFHHIFNAKTGYPIETTLASLTIVSDESIDGEIWSTRLFGLPPKEIIQTLGEMKGIDGLLITKNGGIQFSSGLENKISF
jgi:thiamine biosynthesis lipoprotein